MLNTSPGSSFWSKLSASRTTRLLGIAAAAMLLLIPLGMVESVVWERSAYYQQVLGDISRQWSGEQAVTGPVLRVPFTERWEVSEEIVDKDGDRRVHRRTKSRQGTAILLPDELNVIARMAPQERHRGIYTAQVYAMTISLQGFFDTIGKRIRGLSSNERLHAIHWDRATLVLGLSETRGISSVDAFELDGRTLELAPGTGLNTMKILGAGFHAPATVDGKKRLPFSVEMRLKGSRGFRVAPVGGRTRIDLGSPWPHPSFYGGLLPDNYNTDADGFSAHWDISQLVRPFAQTLRADSRLKLASISAGVRLFQPLTLYGKVTRAAKYGLLFVVLTFLTLAMIEIITDARPSLIQYLLIGIALALFFILLIALAEHLGFTVAYVAGSTTVVSMVGLYSLAVLPRRALAAIVSAVLAALYGVLYIILLAEDYALLTGTLLLLVALAGSMYATRNLHRERGSPSDAPPPTTAAE